MQLIRVRVFWLTLFIHTARTAWALMVHGGTYRAPELAAAV